MNHLLAIDPLEEKHPTTVESTKTIGTHHPYPNHVSISTLILSTLIGTANTLNTPDKPDLSAKPKLSFHLKHPSVPQSPRRMAFRPDLAMPCIVLQGIVKPT
jgi:hypothetical protein